MERTQICLDDRQVEALRALADARGGNVATLVREAVDDYVQRHRDREERLAQFDEAIERIRARIPASIAPGEIEADITDARDEVRTARRHARGG